MEEVLSPEFVSAVRMAVRLQAYDSDLDSMVSCAVDQRAYTEAGRLTKLQLQVQHLRSTLDDFAIAVADSFGSSALATATCCGPLSDLLNGCGPIIANLKAAEREAAGKRDFAIEVVGCIASVALSSRVSELKGEWEALGSPTGPSLSDYVSGCGRRELLPVVAGSCSCGCYGPC